MKTKQEIMDFVQTIKDRDNKRNVHIGDRMVVVSTNNDGFQLMHERDYFREDSGQVYKMKIESIY